MYAIALVLIGVWIAVAIVFFDWYFSARDMLMYPEKIIMPLAVLLLPLTICFVMFLILLAFVYECCCEVCRWIKTKMQALL